MTTADLLTTDDLASYLAVPRQTLAYWRCIGDGPPFLKIGRHVRYRRAGVEAWLDTCADAA